MSFYVIAFRKFIFEIMNAIVSKSGFTDYFSSLDERLNEPAKRDKVIPEPDSPGLFEILV